MQEPITHAGKVQYVDWSVANVFGDGVIEMHKDLLLPEWKSLHDGILGHERDHDFDKGFWHNLKTDLFHTVSSFALIRFMISRPKTWVQLLPFYFAKGRGFVYDKNMCIFYSIILVAIALLIFIYLKGGAI